MSARDLLFLVSAVVAVAGAVSTVISANPLRGAFGLLVHIIALSGVFISLNAHMLAAIQLLVYAGAVVVLFIFVIMLLGPSSEGGGDARGIVTRTMAVGIAAVVFGGLAFFLADVSMEPISVAVCGPGSEAGCVPFGGVEALGGFLFRDAWLAFELVGVLLLVAVVGAVAVARGRNRAELESLQDKRDVITVSDREPSAKQEAA